MGMGFAPTWIRQVSPPASQNHFNHGLSLDEGSLKIIISGRLQYVRDVERRIDQIWVSPLHKSQ